MPANTDGGVGRRIAYYRSVVRPKLTQQELANAACVALGTIRKIERGERGVSGDTLQAIADALGVDPVRLCRDRGTAHSQARDGLPALSAAIAAYDCPDDGPVRPVSELRDAVDTAVKWRLGAQYTRIVRDLPDLLPELARAYHTAADGDRAELAQLLVSAYRCADAAAYKLGAHDLSARLIELMRWVTAAAEDPLLTASVAYVRTETFFAARAHAAGLRALQQAIDMAPVPTTAVERAVRGALHMRAAVIAGRARDADAAVAHLSDAGRLAEQVTENVYYGTAFGPDSVRIHQVSVAVSLGGDHVSAALGITHEWKPPTGLAAERRSGFYIELARAQLWAGMPDSAFESLKVARRVASQHTRDHPWVREDASTLRRLRRADSETLTSFAEWCAAT
ncbi:helix-turn-helix domain-containing protein [Streptomyces sp. CMSTAAHL-2]|uniref:helix-turn-helix domain-containing protein n=1 Tax=Streptomyces sp. CMSTAAHL-2 TaxID=2904522 RepID=UPI001E428AE6|nr:helix-turn-helix transcriptional regulator [Streptomyces sp. CMSTAAHL-2]MCE3030419.1 helix-turn-helix domain-containing protein [Streptomyces sp. CMSTAAHL-2]